MWDRAQFQNPATGISTNRWRQAKRTTMIDSFEIKHTDELIEYLKENGRTDIFESFDYQLQTNCGWIYELDNGRVVFIENSFTHGGLIFKDKDSFNQIIESDKFPIENPDKDLYEVEIERVKTINKQINFYREHLNNVLKFDFAEVTRDSAQSYLSKIVGRSIKKLTVDIDLVALVAIFGEVARREINGKWVLEKWYGAFNPYFVPKIIDSNDKVIPITESVLTSVKWKVTNVASIFKDIQGHRTLNEIRKHRECIVLTD